MVYLKMPWKITFSYNFVFTFEKHFKQKQKSLAHHLGGNIQLSLVIHGHFIDDFAHKVKNSNWPFYFDPILKLSHPCTSSLYAETYAGAYNEGNLYLHNYQTNMCVWSRKTVIHRLRIKRWFQIKRIIAKISQNNAKLMKKFPFQLHSALIFSFCGGGPGDERLPCLFWRNQLKTSILFYPFPHKFGPVCATALFRSVT